MSGKPLMRPVLQRGAAQLRQRQPQPQRCLHTPIITTRTLRNRQVLPSPWRRLQQQRHQSTVAGNARALFARYPLSMAIASGAILLGAGTLLYVNYYYQKYIIAPYHNYPEPVAAKLRRASYFTNQDVQPREALKYYRQALEVAEEIGMDPFTDEIMGIKIRVAHLFEQVEQTGKSIQVLEILRRDAMQWINRYGDTDQEHRKKRSRVLAKCVAISVKLGELYGSPEIRDKEASEERLVWAVETVLKERQRRAAHRISDEDEGPWMSNSEIGASLEALAHNYEEKDQHYLATPLFLQALNLHPTKNCHSVILMNNLATSLAQQSPRAANAAAAYAASTTISSQAQSPPASRETMIENAKTWAQKALDVAAEIKPPERDEECDVGCAVALHNLGEFAEMGGLTEEAKLKYAEAVSLARAIRFQEGVEQSSARLRALKR